MRLKEGRCLFGISNSCQTKSSKIQISNSEKNEMKFHVIKVRVFRARFDAEKKIIDEKDQIK